MSNPTLRSSALVFRWYACLFPRVVSQSGLHKVLLVGAERNADGTRFLIRQYLAVLDPNGI